MSWLARSIANSLKSDFADDESDEEISKNGGNQSRREKKEEEREEIEDRYGLENPGRGVKEDLSELTQTLTRQLWGVASFLAPPPPRPPPPSQSQSQSLILHSSSGSSCLFDSRDPDPGPVDSPRLADIRSDFAEFGGRFRNGISRLSSNKAVSGFSKIASSFIPFGSEEGSEEEYGGAVSGAVGVTDEVLAFARNISMHPETWLDFPLFIDDEYSDDFDMSDVQQEHALAIERLAPRLAALRIELCPSHMSEGCFWKIYFVLLHSRLNKHDAELLLTPQIVEARALWLQELQKQTKPDPGWFGRTTSSYSKGPVHSKTEEYLTSSSNILSETTPLRTHTFEPVNSIPTTDVETQKHCVTSMEMRIINKSVVEERPLIQTTSKDISSSVSKPLDPKFEDEGDDWLEEDNTEIVSTTVPIGNDEDVSFSDLEDDDDRSPPMSSKTLTDVSDSSMKDSRGWVQLSRSTSQSRKDGRHHQADTKESGDWLNVDELDTD